MEFWVTQAFNGISYGALLFLVEQNVALALKLVDYVHILSKGQIVHSCPPEELWGEEEIKARYLGI